MPRSERAITLIDLDHAPVDDQRALVRVLARLAGELGRPAQAELLISRADAAWLTFPARAWTQQAAGVWRGVFAVPAAVVERPEFGFALSIAGHTMALPHPLPVPISGPVIPIAEELTVEHVSRLTGGLVRTRAVAVATALAVTTASSPALALAGQGVAPAPAGQAHAARERIEQLAAFAVERARADAARKRARGNTARKQARGNAASPRSASRRAAAGSVRASHGALAGHMTAVAGVAIAGTAGASVATKRPASFPSRAPAPAGHHSTPRRASDSRDCLHPLAVIAGAPAPTPDTARPIHCGTLSRTATETPAPPGTAPARPPTAATPPPVNAGTAPASAGTTPASGPATPGTTSAPTPAPTTSGTTPTSPTTPTTPPAPGTAGAGSDGASLGAGTTPAPAPAPPVPSVTPTAPGALSPVAPPRLAGSGRERSSRPQLPITPPTTGSGGRSVHLRSDRARRSAQRGAAPVTGPSAVTLTPSPPGFLGPKSWTGTVVNDPSLQSLLGNLSAVLHDINRPPRFLVPIYMEAGRRYHVPWEVLAAINSVETDYGRNLNTSSAGAIGWMQFEPSTWKQWGVAVDGHNVANPYDPRDAIFSGARYLAAAGAATDISRAILAYNHAGWYVDMVLARARAIAGGVHPHMQTNHHGIVLTFFDQWRGHWRARYRGGYLTHYTRLVAAANMVSAADFPYLWGGGHEQPARFGGFDCSGTVSYVLQQAGYVVPTLTSGNVPSWHFPAGPGRVTIFYNAGHTFMRIGGRYFGTSTSRPGGGAGWIGTDRLPESYLAGFHEVHVPSLRGDAFAAARRHRLAAQRRSEHATHPAPLRFTPFPAQTSSKLQLTFPTT